MPLTNVAIEEINIGPRFRGDFSVTEDEIQSVKDKGIIQPITLTPDLGLIAGRRRIEMATKAGLLEVPAVIRKVEDELDYREIELIENVHRKDFNWADRAKLEAHIFDLKKTKHGWGQREVAEHLGESVGALNRRMQLAKAMEVVPELANESKEDHAWKKLHRAREQAVVRELQKRTDVAKSALHQFVEDRYNVGNCVVGMEALSGATFEFAEVDPPYGINLVEEKRQSETTQVEEYTEVPAKEYGAFVFVAAQEVYRLLKPDTFCIWWFGPTHWDTVKRALKRAKFKVDDIPAVWIKPQGQTQQPKYNLANAYEPFFVCRKGKPQLAIEGQRNVFEYAGVHGGSKIHPTQRPLPLMTHLLKTFTQPGSNVLVPFLGSGVTLQAAHKTGMDAIGWDLSETNRDNAIAEAALWTK